MLEARRTMLSTGRRRERSKDFSAHFAGKSEKLSSSNLKSSR